MNLLLVTAFLLLHVIGSCTGGSCRDYNALKCKNWAKRNECSKNPKWMSSNCCSSCRSISSSSCKDTRDDCAYWSKKGTCSNKDYAWFKLACCSSCKGKTGNNPAPRPGKTGNKGKSTSGSSGKAIGNSKKMNGGDPASDLARACLKIHNEKRALHRNTPPLVYDATLGAGAQEWANTNARSRNMYHSSRQKRNNAGENLAYRMTYKDMDDAQSVVDAADRWYSEIKDWRSCKSYGYVLHFTQMVWKATTKLGCGVGRNGKYIYVAARYMIAGNMGGEFCANVLPLK